MDYGSVRRDFFACSGIKNLDTNKRAYAKCSSYLLACGPKEMSVQLLKIRNGVQFEQQLRSSILRYYKSQDTFQYTL